MSIYVPPDCRPLSSNTGRPQIRLMLQGEPKIGKTWAAMTFPNPIVVNFDRGLGAFAGSDSIIEVPFWDAKFCDTLIPRTSPTIPSNRKDAFRKWMIVEAPKITIEQTLVIDGNTGIQNAFETQFNLNPAVTDNGKIDKFAIWRAKIEYFGQICETFKTIQCDIVYICHESPDRNDKGDLNGRIKPLLSGQFADQLASHFSDNFRCHCISKPKDESGKTRIKMWSGVDDTTLNTWIKESVTDNIYLWQTDTDDLAACGVTTLVNQPKFIIANWTSFQKYMRKPISK